MSRIRLRKYLKLNIIFGFYYPTNPTKSSKS
jgi:hypothetical protein